MVSLIEADTFWQIQIDDWNFRLKFHMQVWSGKKQVYSSRLSLLLPASILHSRAYCLNDSSRFPLWLLYPPKMGSISTLLQDLYENTDGGFGQSWSCKQKLLFLKEYLLGQGWRYANCTCSVYLFKIKINLM